MAKEFSRYDLLKKIPFNMRKRILPTAGGLLHIGPFTYKVLRVNERKLRFTCQLHSYKEDSAITTPDEMRGGGLIIKPGDARWPTGR